MAYNPLSASQKSKIIFIIITGIASILFYFIYTRDHFLQLRPIRPYSSEINATGPTQLEKKGNDIALFENIHINKRNKYNWRIYDFDPFKNQTLVFIHIQKTGGTNLEKRLVKELYNFSCSCPGKKTSRLSCDCRRSKTDKEVWLICRYTRFGKLKSWPCGVHPDWTELQFCVPYLLKRYVGVNPHRKLLYFTQLRNPIDRFLSEFLHVKRGATWQSSNHFCKGKRPTENEIKCFDGDQWLNASLKEFVNCEKNLAINRQARMLSNLELVNCYNLSAMKKTARDNLILKSAMENLKSISYFSLMGYPSESQFLFEKTFNLKFKKPWPLLDMGYASFHRKNIPENDLKLFKKVNYLDMKLYKFAKKLFFERLEYAIRVFGDKPKKTIVNRNHKDILSLKNNWKNKSIKVKVKKRGGRTNKKRNSVFYEKVGK